MHRGENNLTLDLLFPSHLPALFFSHFSCVVIFCLIKHKTTNVCIQPKKKNSFLYFSLGALSSFSLESWARLADRSFQRRTRLELFLSPLVFRPKTQKSMSSFPTKSSYSAGRALEVHVCTIKINVCLLKIGNLRTWESLGIWEFGAWGAWGA